MWDDLRVLKVQVQFKKLNHLICSESRNNHPSKKKKIKKIKTSLILRFKLKTTL